MGLLRNIQLPRFSDSYDGYQMRALVRQLEDALSRIKEDTMTSVVYADSSNLDAFGRLRVSNSQTIFDSQHGYTNHPLLWESVTSGTGTVVHSAVSNTITLSTGGISSSARAMRRTKVYHRYQPGKSQLVKMTGVPVSSGLHNLAGTSVSRMGYYDDNDGVFFAAKRPSPAFVLRSSTSGTVVDTEIIQTSWNLDMLDGSGPSRVALDTTKEHIVIIDLQWLGAGRIRTGFQIDGMVVYAHEFLNANVKAEPYMRSANLPLTYEILNTGPGANVSMTQTCAVIESEGGVTDEGGYVFTLGTSGSTVSLANSATLTPIVSFRLVDTFNGIRYRGHVHPKTLAILNTGTNSVYWELLLNASLTGSTFANTVDATYSGVEYDTIASAHSGGVRVAAGYSGSGAANIELAANTDIAPRLLLARTYATGLPNSGGGTRDIFTLAGRGIGGTTTVAASIGFEEQY